MIAGTVKSETFSDRDAGFCSGEDTDFDYGFHSPTETSRDSGAGSYSKDSSETYRTKNKRKSLEPRKVDEFDGEAEPEAKLIKLESPTTDEVISSSSPYQCEFVKADSREDFQAYVKPSSSPFRPWNVDTPIPSSFVQEEPLSLVVEKKYSNQFFPYHSSPVPGHTWTSSTHTLSVAEAQDLRTGPSLQERLQGLKNCDVPPSQSSSIQLHSFSRLVSNFLKYLYFQQNIF